MLLAFVAAVTINVIPGVDARPEDVPPTTLTCREGDTVPVVEHGEIANYYCEDVAQVLERGHGAARLATPKEVSDHIGRIIDDARAERASAERKEYWIMGGGVAGALALAGVAYWLQRRRNNRR